MAKTHDTFGGVRKCIVEALDVSAGEVTPDARLIRDLGAESVDLLDIVFRLERAFGIRIPRGAVERDAKKRVKTWRQRGILTEEALQVLRNALPEVDPGEIKLGLRPKDIPTLFTVQTFVRIVDEEIARGGGAAAGDAGGARGSRHSWRATAHARARRATP
jgi:acyl carrier protein